MVGTGVPTHPTAVVVVVVAVVADAVAAVVVACWGAVQAGVGSSFGL
jgi:hypothetical protein